MKNTSLYIIIGIVLLIVLLAMYFVYKSNQNTITTQNSMINSNSREINKNKNCTLLYNNWQNALKELEAAKATGLTMAEINSRTVTARNAEITYNNCLNS